MRMPSAGPPRASAKKLGPKTVPVRVAKDLTPAQFRACRLADNKTAERAEWDVELAEYLGEFDTDLQDSQSGPEEAGETIRRPKFGHEFACPVFDAEALFEPEPQSRGQTRRERGRRATR